MAMAARALRPDHPAETVYLLHFERPYRHARHYLGTTTDLDARLADHAAGAGARLLQVVRAAGIQWELARTWAGGRDLERHLKGLPRGIGGNGHHGGLGRLCPVCQAERSAAAQRDAAFTAEYQLWAMWLEQQPV